MDTLNIEFIALAQWIQSAIYKETLGLVLESWHQHTTLFAQTRSLIYKEKSESNRTLKLTIGHSRYLKEYNQLNQRAQESHQSLISCVTKLGADTTSSLEGHSILFMERIEYTTARLFGILDGLVNLDDDVLIPNVPLTPATASSMPTQSSGSGSGGEQSEPRNTAKTTAPNSNTPPTSKQEWQPLLSLRLPLPIFKDGSYCSQVLESRPTKLHQSVIQFRDSVFEEYANGIIKRMEILNDHISVEMNSASNWISQWDDNATRIKNSYN